MVCVGGRGEASPWRLLQGKKSEPVTRLVGFLKAQPVALFRGGGDDASYASVSQWLLPACAAAARRGMRRSPGPS